MDTAVETYSAAVRDVSSLDDLESLTSETLGQMGFNHFILGWRSPGKAHEAFGPYDRNHLAAYREEGFQEVDPVAQLLAKSWLPVAWDYRDHLSAPNPQCAELFRRSRAVGYQCGVSTQISGPTGQKYVLACIYDGRPDSFWARHAELGHELLILGPYLARMHHELAHRDEETTSLTERERQCLTWTSRGKTAWEISKILGVRERTVNFHLQNAMGKLETSSKHHAWLKAVNLGMIAAA